MVGQETKWKLCYHSSLKAHTWHLWTVPRRWVCVRDEWGWKPVFSFVLRISRAKFRQDPSDPNIIRGVPQKWDTLVAFVVLFYPIWTILDIFRRPRYEEETTLLTFFLDTLYFAYFHHYAHPKPSKIDNHWQGLPICGGGIVFCLINFVSNHAPITPIGPLTPLRSPPCQNLYGQPWLKFFGN